MVDKVVKAGEGDSIDITKESVPAVTNYKRLEELKQIMGQKHGRKKSQKFEEIKLLTTDIDLEPY